MEIFENLSASSRQEPEELDSYSRTVREVTERLSPAVVSVGSANGRSGGSGVILGTGEGTATAVTNSHVVRGLAGAGGGQGGRQGSGTGRGGLRVSLADGAQASVEVLGDDPSSDLAVIRFEPEVEPAVAPLGEAGNLGSSS
jgi:S1-C subfamily serine protease